MKSNTILIIFLVFLSFLSFNCASTKNEIIKEDTETLKIMWSKSQQFSIRNKILLELERRKEVDSLIWCLMWTYRGHGNRINRHQDYLSIMEVFGRLKDPIVVREIGYSFGYVNTEKIIAALKTLKEFKNPEAVLLIKGLLSHEDEQIRWQAVDTLSYIETHASIEAIFTILFDKDRDIRWKAVHALGEIGNPQAADRISLLLADSHESVRGIAENVLRKLGTSEAQIADWKKKAGQLSIDDIYSTKLAYDSGFKTRKWR